MQETYFIVTKCIRILNKMSIILCTSPVERDKYKITYIIKIEAFNLIINKVYFEKVPLNDINFMNFVFCVNHIHINENKLQLNILKSSTEIHSYNSYPIFCVSPNKFTNFFDCFVINYKTFWKQKEYYTAIQVSSTVLINFQRNPSILYVSLFSFENETFIVDLSHHELKNVAMLHLNWDRFKCITVLIL